MRRVREIEAVIRQEPEIAYRLLKHIDSVGFGLSVPVQNFQHAVMFMGYQGLRRWLSLMLVSVSADESRRPLMLASFRRGLILERLAGPVADTEAREEMFLLGVFSLLDRALGQPLPGCWSGYGAGCRARGAGGGHGSACAAAASGGVGEQGRCAIRTTGWRPAM